MANQITGKILHIYPAETIAGKNGNITKRAILIDCTRFDPYTGERGFENTPLLEFIGEKCNELNNFQPGQVATVTFDIQGTRYTRKDGTEDVFTRVQPYKIELRQAKSPQPQPIQQPQYQPQQPMAPQYQPQQPMAPQYQPQQPQQPYYPKGAGECPF